MRLVRDLNSADLCPSGSVVTLGNFDGLHRGHQALCERTLRLAEGHETFAVAVSFDPMPQEFFAASNPPARLQRTSEKVAGFQRAGFELLWLLRFNRAVAELSPDAFVDRVLVSGLGARAVVIGEDFRYGQGRLGDVEHLRLAGAANGFDVEVVEPVMIDGERVSSTAIRRALADERFDVAAHLLGRPYRMSGRVLYGRQLGRTLGFPTVNLSIGRLRSPLQGIFAVRVFGASDGPLNGVASIGTRPTVDDSGIVLLEVHIFDFSGELYGRRLEVEFAVRLREERRFDNVDELQRQMEIDGEQARAFLTGASMDA